MKPTEDQCKMEYCEDVAQWPSELCEFHRRHVPQHIPQDTPTDIKVPPEWLYDARADVAEALRQLHLVYTERDEHWAAAVDWLLWADRRLRNALDPKNQLPF